MGQEHHPYDRPPEIRSAAVFSLLQLLLLSLTSTPDRELRAAQARCSVELIAEGLGVRRERLRKIGLYTNHTGALAYIDEHKFKKWVAKHSPNDLEVWEAAANALVLGRL